MEDGDDEATPILWDIRRGGRSWTPEEFTARADRLVELKLEISKGKLFWSDETRMLILGMLLENMGMDAVVRLGDVGRWKEAVAAVERERGGG